MPTYIKNKILGAIILFLVTLEIGIIGYRLIAPDSTILEATYMTIITLSTVGYGEVIDLTANPAGKIFTMILILFGMGNILYVVNVITSFITDGELQEVLRRRKMQKVINKIKDHLLICGSGIICKKIIQELIETKRQFVLVTENEEFIKTMSELHKNLIHIDRDPSMDENLVSAGINEACGMIACLEDDKDNLLVVVTAKKLHPQIRIIAKANDPDMISKFKTVGVDTVISPNLIGGLRIVSEMIRPSVTTFLDIMLRDKSNNTRFENVFVEADSSIKDKTIGESKIWEKTGLIVVSLQKPGREGFIYNPSQNELLTEGTSIIVIGSTDQVAKLKRMASQG